MRSHQWITLLWNLLQPTQKERKLITHLTTNVSLKHIDFLKNIFHNDNCLNMNKRFFLCRSVFNFDVETLDYQKYIQNWVLGSRRFMLKLEDKSIPQAKKTFNLLFCIDFVVKSLICSFIGYFILNRYFNSFI